jgi:hypothetical protein
MPQTIKTHRSSGRKDRDLFGSSDPSLNRATSRQPSPDEFRLWGCRDGRRSVMRSSLCENPLYLKWWDCGYAERKAEEARSEAEKQEFTVAWSRPSLNEILSDVKWWSEKTENLSQIKIDFDTDNQEYVIRIASNLLNQVIPF